MTSGADDKDVGDRLVCATCIGAIRFSSWIEANGKRGKCDFRASHGRSHKVIKIEAFAVEVDRFFRDSYWIGEEHDVYDHRAKGTFIEQYGRPYKDIFSEELECEPAVTDSISSCLPDVGHREIAQGDTPFYDDSFNYETFAETEKRRDEEWQEHWYELRFHFQWRDFSAVVQYERRFFKIKELLDGLFGTPGEYGGGTIRPMYGLPAGTILYRARALDHEFTESTLSADPARVLSAPPKDKARAGRMNVEYIPAFYGAFCEETAVAEIRPGIGDLIAVGQFALTKELKVFDFTAFSRPGGNWRDFVKHTRYEFISQMEDEISRPISPFAKQRDYIPTQIVAEYLREHFGCDAVIYKSSMQRDEARDNRNIVILNRGQEFVGTEPDRVLAFKSHDVKEIYNVHYDVRGAVLF